MRSEEIRKEALSVYSHANMRDRYDADLMMAGFSDGAEWADAHPVAVGEPQGEPSEAWVRAVWDALGASNTVHIAYDDLCAALRAAVEVKQGEPSDAPNLQFMARKGGKTQALIDSMLDQANDRGIRVEIVDQTIPKSAMLDVWMALYDHDTSHAFDPFYEGAGYAEAWSTLLSAIRARSGEPQGEPSDDYELAVVSRVYEMETKA